MSDESSQETVTRFYHVAFVKHDLKAAKELMDTNYILHDPSFPNLFPGPVAWEKAQSKYLEAIPDHHFTVLRRLMDGEFVTTHWKVEGTQKGDLPGIPASHRSFSITGMTITRASHGKIIEEWQNWDTQGFLEQLGAVSKPELLAA
jgi:steroid delta-isomerase-like uncharacterized protein